MKLISWNVNGLRACIQKGFLDQFDKFDADFFCLQETKLSEGQLELALPGYYQYWCYAEKKGYSGTAIFAKHEPLSVHYGLDVPELDNEGRLITLEYPEFFLVTCYTPNAQRELARIDHRMKWDEAFRAYLQRLDAQKPVILCGDLNVAHQEIDLKNPKSNRGNAGFSDQERESFGKTLSLGFTDTFRHLHPDAKDKYTWWSYMFKAREKNAGWRIDYFLVSDRIRETVYRAEIHGEILGSDHCPVSMETDLPCNGSIFSHSAPGKARDLSRPEPKEAAKEASAVKAKALVPFVAIFAVLLSVFLLWDPLLGLFSTQDPTEPSRQTSPDPAYFTVCAYEDVPWSYAKTMIYGTNQFVSTGSMYADIFDDGQNRYDIPATRWDAFTNSNIALRIDLTQAALDLNLDLYKYVTVELTPARSLFESVPPTIHYEILDYKLTSSNTQSGGWFILAYIPDSRNYTVTVTWEDAGISCSQRLYLSPTGTDIPYELEDAFTVEDLSGRFPEIYELPTENGASELHFGDRVFYAATPNSGRQIQNDNWWYLVTPDSRLTDVLAYDSLFLTARCGINSDGDDILYGSEIPDGPVFSMFILATRPVYSDPGLTQQLGWLVSNYSELPQSLTLSLVWQNVASKPRSSQTLPVQTVTVTEDTFTAQQLLDRLVGDPYTADQLATGQFGQIWEIPLVKWLAEKPDCIDVLMNYVPTPEDTAAFVPFQLLSYYEFYSMMTTEQEIRFLTGNFASNPNDPPVLALELDDDPTGYTTDELATWLWQFTSTHSELLWKCSDSYTQHAMLEYMQEQIPTLAEFLSREDMWVVLEQFRSIPGYESSILYFIGMLTFPEDPAQMTTEQLIQAILNSPELCDLIHYGTPDFSVNPLLTELSGREDAVSALMSCPLPNDPDTLEIPYLLLSHPVFFRKMTPIQEANWVFGYYTSCPFEIDFAFDWNLNVSDMATWELLFAVMRNGDASMITLGSTTESRYLIFCYLTDYSPQLQELAFRTDAMDVIAQQLNANPTSSYLDPTLLALLEIWPTVEAEYPLYMNGLPGD